MCCFATDENMLQNQDADVMQTRSNFSQVCRRCSSWERILGLITAGGNHQSNQSWFHCTGIGHLKPIGLCFSCNIASLPHMGAFFFSFGVIEPYNEIMFEEM